MTDKIVLPKVAYSKSDDGLIDELYNDWDNDLPCKVYFLTQAQAAQVVEALKMASWYEFETSDFPLSSSIKKALEIFLGAEK
jgi:hypothetical protein